MFGRVLSFQYLRLRRGSLPIQKILDEDELGTDAVTAGTACAGLRLKINPADGRLTFFPRRPFRIARPPARSVHSQPEGRRFAFEDEQDLFPAPQAVASTGRPFMEMCVLGALGPRSFEDKDRHRFLSERGTRRPPEAAISCQSKRRLILGSLWSIRCRTQPTRVSPRAGPAFFLASFSPPLPTRSPSRFGKNSGGASRPFDAKLAAAPQKPPRAAFAEDEGVCFLSRNLR